MSRAVRPLSRPARRLSAALVATLTAAALATPAPAAAAGEYALYLLSGQSNMDGYGRLEELPPELAGEQAGVVIFHGNTSEDGTPEDGRGRWETLRPGHGVGFTSDGETNVPSGAFGVELSFARRLAELEPGRPVALVKYSRGGTSIAAAAAGSFGCWDPDFDGGEGAGAGVNQYDHCLATLRRALAVRDVNGDGEDDVLVPAGILWMQGESDAAHGPDIALAYEANLGRLMDLLRAALRVDDLPVAVGRISDSGRGAGGRTWAWGETVRAAQQAWCEADGAAALVTSTDDYGYSDPWHYDGAGYVDLGERFAEAIFGLHAARAAHGGWTEHGDAGTDAGTEAGTGGDAADAGGGR